MAKRNDQKNVPQKKKSGTLQKLAQTPEQKKRIDAFIQRVESAQPPKFAEGKGLADEVMGWVGLLEALGTSDVGLSKLFITQACDTLFGSNYSGIDGCNLILAALHGINPKNELEGMLAVQMVGVHNLAMECMKRAMLEDQTTAGVDTNVNRATKLLRTFTAQIEALNRYRGKGQQKVIVKHVHVNEGGQAIVGNVEGGGANAKKRG